MAYLSCIVKKPVSKTFLNLKTTELAIRPQSKHTRILTAMNLTPIATASGITKAQRRFAANVAARLPQKQLLSINTKGSEDGPYDIWAFCDVDGFWAYIRPGRPSDTSHYWNSFGRVETAKQIQSPRLECNSPHTGSSRRQGALFAASQKGTRVYLLHTGKIGGGKKGVGKSYFQDWLRKYHRKDVWWATLTEEKREDEQVVVLGAVDSPKLMDSIKRYMDLAWDFKQSRPKPKQAMKKKKKSKKATKKTRHRSRAGLGKLIGMAFAPERYATRTARRGAKNVNHLHGKVVKALERWTMQRYGKHLAAGNEQTVDLLLADKKTKRVVRVFEVKTDVGSQPMYTGIGQLLVHSSRASQSAKTLVIPRGKLVDQEIYKVVRELKITILTYHHKSRKYRFGPYGK